MRIYKTFPDALNEIKRDIAELGTRVHPETMQDKYIADDVDYETMEYLNMIYTVTQPSLEDLVPHVKTLEWCEAEFQERLAGLFPGQGDAWKLRPEVWEEFATSANGLGYTYGERYAESLLPIIKELDQRPNTRQAFLSVWDPTLDSNRLGHIRVPCSLGYWFARRNGRLNITYLQRSGDYFTHLANDMYLTHKLQRYVADMVGVDVGIFTHWVGSVHVYQKDVADVF